MNEQMTAVPTAAWPLLKPTGRLEQIIDIIAEEGGVERDKITPDATLETLGVQSMDVVMILMEVEEKLDAYIPMNAQLSAARNLAEFVGAISEAMDTPVKPADASKPT